MKALQVLTILLALTGLFYIGKKIFSFARNQREAKHYATHCSLIRPGMTLRQVREAMGDNSWDAMKNSPSLYFNHSKTDPAYVLYYPPASMASGGPVVAFDTLTFRVKEVNCHSD